MWGSCRKRSPYDLLVAGGGLMIYLGFVTQDEALKKFIDFNTLGLLTGMMLLIAVVKRSGFLRPWRCGP